MSACPAAMSIKERRRANRKTKIGGYRTGGIEAIGLAGLLGPVLRQRLCFVPFKLCCLGGRLKREASRYFACGIYFTRELGRVLAPSDCLIGLGFDFVSWGRWLCEGQGSYSMSK